MSSDPIVLDTLPVSVMKYFEQANLKKKAFVWAQGSRGLESITAEQRHGWQQEWLRDQAGGREHTGSHDTLLKPQIYS